MANLFVDLPFPALNGPGAAVDTSALGKSRSIIVKGSFPGVTVTVQISNDGGTTWAPVVTFTSTGSKKVVDVAAQFMRVNVKGRKSGAPFSANCDIGANDNGGQFATLPLPVGDGVGAPVDISAMGLYTTVVVAGSFKGVLITVESSEDGNDWAACGPSYQSGSSQRSGEMVANFARVRVAGRKSTESFSAVVSIGSINEASAAGGPPTGPAGGDLTFSTYPNPTVSRPRAAFVYQPGGVAGSNIYTDWATLLTAMAAVSGSKVLQFDDEFVSPIPIPAGGPYDMTDVEWQGKPLDHGGRGIFGTSQMVPVEISDGASFTKLRRFTGSIVVTNQCVAPSPSPIADLASVGFDFIEAIEVSGGSCIRSIDGAVPMIDYSGCASASYSSVFVDEGLIGHGGNGIVFGNIPDGATVGFDLRFQGAIWNRRAISGTAASDVWIYYAQDAYAPYLPQTNLLSTPSVVDISGYGPVFGVVPPVPLPASTVPITGDRLGRLLRLNSAAGVIAQPLPPATGSGGTSYTGGRVVWITETSGVNGVTVTPNGSDTINGGPSFTVPPGGTAVLISDGALTPANANWSGGLLATAAASGAGSGFVPQGGPQLLGASAGFLSARALFVNPAAGDAADDGNQDTPFITIQGAINAVPLPASALEELQRNTIFVASGSYDEDVVVPPSRRIALIGLGPVTLGDGALANGGSTTPRSLTWNIDQASEFGNARPQLVIGSMWHGSESSSTHTAFMTAWDISGDLITATGVVSTHDLHLHRVKVQGDFDGSADLGGLNLYEYNCFFDQLHNTPTGILNVSESTEYDGLITINNYCRFELAQIQGGLTCAIGPSGNIPPTGMYNCDFSGTYTGPALSLWLDAASNYFFKLNGAVLAGGATKTILGDLVP